MTTITTYKTGIKAQNLKNMVFDFFWGDQLLMAFFPMDPLQCPKNAHDNLSFFWVKNRRDVFALRRDHLAALSFCENTKGTNVIAQDEVRVVGCDSAVRQRRLEAILTERNSDRLMCAFSSAWPVPPPRGLLVGFLRTQCRFLRVLQTATTSPVPSLQLPRSPAKMKSTLGCFLSSLGHEPHICLQEAGSSSRRYGGRRKRAFFLVVAETLQLHGSGGLHLGAEGAALVQIGCTETVGVACYVALVRA